CHRPRDSLFSWSSGFNNFTGFINWGFLLLGLGGVRLLLENFIKYGIRVNPREWFFFLSGKNDGGEESPSILLICYSLVPVMLCLLIEKGLALNIIAHNPGIIFHVVNLIVMVLMPMVVIHVKDSGFSLIGAVYVCMLYAILFFKLWSYVQNMDVAKACERLLKLAIPNHLMWLCFFYLFFHSYLNLMGELLYFADRNFYSDWWNANNIDTFWRTWNMAVHRWAVRHLYIPIVEMGYGKTTAGVVVFFISAFFHEYVVSVPLKTFKIWAFLGMMGQIPLSYVSKYVEKQFGARWGNIVVWSSLIIGQPLCIMVHRRLRDAHPEVKRDSSERARGGERNTRVEREIGVEWETQVSCL
ncbi:hypothetical protein PV328_011522, partial [Microctonus aethiopoides]